MTFCVQPNPSGHFNITGIYPKNYQKVYLWVYLKEKKHKIIIPQKLFKFATCFEKDNEEYINGV